MGLKSDVGIEKLHFPQNSRHLEIENVSPTQEVG
jgi:hypothetical protein